MGDAWRCRWVTAHISAIPCCAYACSCPYSASTARPADANVFAKRAARWTVEWPCARFSLLRSRQHAPCRKWLGELCHACDTGVGCSAVRSELLCLVLQFDLHGTWLTFDFTPAFLVTLRSLLDAVCLSPFYTSFCRLSALTPRPVLGKRPRQRARTRTEAQKRRANKYELGICSVLR